MKYKIYIDCNAVTIDDKRNNTFDQWNDEFTKENLYNWIKEHKEEEHCYVEYLELSIELEKLIKDYEL